MISRLKEIDDSLELEKRLGIGGEIYFVGLTKDGLYTIETIHQFLDYEKDFSEMLNSPNLRRDIIQKRF